MLIKIEGKQATLNSAATPQVLAIARQLEGRRAWMPGGRGLNFEATEHNLRIMRDGLGAQVQSADGPPPTNGDAGRMASDLIEGRPYLSKTQPYDHQLRAGIVLRQRRTVGLFMEQGTGKTKCALDAAGEQFNRGWITGLLVVSKKGVHRQWIESEAPRHLGIDWAGWYWPMNKKQPAYSPAPDPRKVLKIFSINYDALRTDKGFKAAHEFCSAHAGKLMIVADESQEIKNYRAERHKRMIRLAPLASHRILTTGTPIAKDLTDEWAQLKWLDERILGIRYVTTFRTEYCVMGGFEGRVVVGHRNVERFKALTKPAIFRATKEELGLEAKQFATWHYDISTEQRRLIQTIKGQLEAQLSATKTVAIANAVSAMTKMQQVASGFLIDEGGKLHKLKDNPRLEAALEWLEDGADEDGVPKSIIWFRFKEEGRMLADACAAAKISHVLYYGETNTAGRKEAIDSFMAPEGARVFLANPQSAGTGLNLQGLCRRALYYTNSFAAIDRWQSEDRIHRIGTKGIVTYTDMIARGTLDNYVLRNLQRKAGFAESILSNKEEIYDALSSMELAAERAERS